MIYYVFVIRKFPINMGPVCNVYGDMAFFFSSRKHTPVNRAYNSWSAIKRYATLNSCQVT